MLICEMKCTWFSFEPLPEGQAFGHGYTEITGAGGDELGDDGARCRAEAGLREWGMDVRVHVEQLWEIGSSTRPCSPRALATKCSRGARGRGARGEATRACAWPACTQKAALGPQVGALRSLPRSTMVDKHGALGSTTYDDANLGTREKGGVDRHCGAVGIGDWVGEAMEAAKEGVDGIIREVGIAEDDKKDVVEGAPGTVWMRRRGRRLGRTWRRSS